jgi:hypothetical protein
LQPSSVQIGATTRAPNMQVAVPDCARHVPCTHRKK